jgi:plasmid stabilization system protein ParE
VRPEFHPDAAEEFGAAVEYYEAAVSGLGNRFLLAVRQATDLILADPEIGRPRGIARRFGVPGFPYDVAYRVRAEVVEVLAIAHHHRRPGYWRARG